jgi:hypothetical protein
MGEVKIAHRSWFMLEPLLSSGPSWWKLPFSHLTTLIPKPNQLG